MQANLTLKLEPITSTKPRATIDAAVDVARRIGCHVAVEVNGAIVRISPTAARGTVFDTWSAAKAGVDAQHLNADGP
jgi:hypothetical protein